MPDFEIVADLSIWYHILSEKKTNEKNLDRSELPISRKVPKTNQKFDFWRLINFEQFLGLFS